jgi:hypothetical protein
MCELMLFNEKWAIFQLQVYHGENKLHALMTPLLKCMNNAFNIFIYTYIQTLILLLNV